MLRWACISVLLVSVLGSAAQPGDDDCKKCDAHGELREPNKAFTYQENCREYLCKCECSGNWDCPPERVETFCQPSNPQCGTCWAGGAMQQGNSDFKFTEGCFQYNCFCNCDGAWNCPPKKTIDICNYNVTSGCYYCDVYGNKHQGNSIFKHVNGCIEYDCTCNCDGSWNCPGERAIDTCNQNPDTKCYYCDVYGKRYEGNSHFVHTNGCIEYKCACNCDGSWDCPGAQAVDKCRTNRKTGCYYCDVHGYMYEGGTQFPYIEKCFKYTCDCNCDGGWTCANSTGRYACDKFGNAPISECKSCTINGAKYRGDSRFFYEKGCITYKCTCDCAGRFYCPGNEAFYTCPGSQNKQIASLSSSYTYVYTQRTRSPRQASGCIQCVVDKKQYDTYQTFTRQIDCNVFTCTCQCDGTPNCPPSTMVNKCLGPTGGGSGASTFGSEIDPDYEIFGGVSTCTECRYRGLRYEGNTPFTFESGCWKYNCNCRCNGSIDCPSDKSEYICPGRKECIKCKVDNQLIDANSDFELRRNCVFYDRCRCNCDGGWTCEDGRYTCDLCQGCTVDGRSFAGNSSFELTRGCDKYKNCYCGCDTKWQCSGEVEDLCGACRKCNIGDDYFNGDTSFRAEVGCTTYRSCDCNCDGSYKCVRGYFTCNNRGDMPVEELCPDCAHGTRRYRPGQSFDYTDGCRKYRGCQCKCGKTTCTEVEDSCGNCRSCLVDSTEYRGGTKFSKKKGCLQYNSCDCFCSGEWKCYGESAVDTCNTCKKCNVDAVIHQPYGRFKLNRDCWRYHCFCGCDGSTMCPSETAVNTCTRPNVCYTCEVEGQDHRGNTLFEYKVNNMTMSCKCNCDGSYYCIAEWLYIRTDLTISGQDLGGCFYCFLEGRRFRGDTKFSITRDDIDLECECFCNGGYYCRGEKKYISTACRGCSVYGTQYQGDLDFSIVYNGLKLACQCSCDGTYLCYGTEGTAVISCIAGVGCLTQTCGQCIVQGELFNGGDVFGSTYKGIGVNCECGCDGSYYCEGSGGIILSCVGGFCRELGCTSCEVFDFNYDGDTDFGLIYQGLKLECACQCGGSYQCIGAGGEVIVSCVDGGSGCLRGTCGNCLVDNKRYSGRSQFRTIYNGIDMKCSCSCDGSYYCEGVYEQIEISCIGGTCTRLGCKSCNIYGNSIAGDNEFSMTYGGLKVDCQCQCTSDYICMGSTGTAVISCIGGRNCLPATCGSCYFNNREIAGGSTFRSVYKGIDILCTCGCDSSAFCTGTTTSIEVTCIGGSCRRIGCDECSIFGKEMLGSSQFDLTYEGYKLACECDCDGGYKCRGSNGVVVITCINGRGPGCLNTRCGQCVVDGNSYPGYSTFKYVYQGIDMTCSCSCDSSYHCVGVSELIEVSCFRGTCTPIGCNECRLFNNKYTGAKPFQIVYGGYLLDCKCNCDGSYVCFREDTTVPIIQCQLGVSCLPSTCQSCFVNSRPIRGGSTFRDVYNGIDVTCTCGCDSSYLCVGVSTDIKVSCLNGRCSLIGCTGCNVYGSTYESLNSFKLIYRGMQLDCNCDCKGGYICTGSKDEVFVRCRDGINCLDSLCNTCNFNGQVITGTTIFKYDYRGIDMSCTCGCDGNVWCIGVTTNIELRCIDGTCTPVGCLPCNIYGREIAPDSAFNIVNNGKRLDCTCSCDSRFQCLWKGKEVIDCPPGRGNTCLDPTCRECVMDGLQRTGRSVFPYVFKDIEMNCTCGCDGTVYCQGVSVDIILSCIGGRCSPIDCRTCSLFGKNYEAYTPFNIVYGGERLDCTCGCDASLVCRGEGGPKINCKPGDRCLSPTCQDCMVEGRRRNARSSFPYIYEGIQLQCECGCDGTSYCKGVIIDIVIACVGGRCSPVGCAQCSLFGQNYPAYKPFNIIYEGSRLDCTCKCDSSFVCLGKSGRKVFDCKQGDRCLPSTCQDCMVGGRRRKAGTPFPYVYEGIDVTCTCGCEGSAYCKGVRTDIILSCVGGRCSPVGCQACNIFGQNYKSYKPFNFIYEGSRLDCTCDCNANFICRGKSGTSVIDCKAGERCFDFTTCKDCMVGGRRRRTGSTFPYVYEGIDVKCTCGCDGSAWCEGVREILIIGCVRGTCAPRGCKQCSLFGRNYDPYQPFKIVYQGTQIDCTCKCDSSFVCYGKSPKQPILQCRPGQRCPTDASCQNCLIGGVRRRPWSQFSHEYQGIDFKCHCGCDGSSYCEGVTEKNVILSCIGGSCSLTGCRECNIFGKNYKAYTPFDIIHKGTRIDCTCKCDTSFLCVGHRTGQPVVDCKAGGNCIGRRCTEECVVEGQRYRPRTTFALQYRNIDMNCRCGCDGTAFCEGVTQVYYVSCIGNRCFQEGCKDCNLFGIDFPSDAPFKTVFKGINMDCQCNCDSSWRCEGKAGRADIDCGVGKRCAPKRCRKCRVGNTRYNGRDSFQFDYQNIRMNCVCGCDGTYHCLGVSVDYETACTRKGKCKQIGGCRQCSIFGSNYYGGSRTDFVYQGYFMKCTCKCDSSFKCIGTKGNVVVDCGINGNCLINQCGPCRVDGITYRGGAVFDTVYLGKNQECTCGCDGSYFCRCKDDNSELTCAADGTCQQLGCSTCLSDGRRRQADEEFEKIYDNIRMNCVCKCDGSYRCQGVSVSIVILCTGRSCNLVGCRSCMVEGQERPSGSDYVITENRIRKRCRCECDGTSTCKDEGRPACTDCFMEGRTFKGHTVDRIFKNGQPYICECYCNGQGQCKPERKRCTDCDIFGQRFRGDQVFETTVKGTTMQCSCDCSGSFECKGGGQVCTSAYGCRTNCPGCVIEGTTYTGNTNFDIFHKGYGIPMNCDCKCGGSYKCTGTKSIAGQCPGGNCANKCYDCTVGGRTYQGGRPFNTVIDGIQMQCNCYCTGGYKCEGKITRTQICTGVGCLANGCTECKLDSRTFQPNTQFEIQNAGLVMQCSCACNGTLECRGERIESLCIGDCDKTCRDCSYAGGTIPSKTRREITRNGVRQNCECDCDGRLSCQEKQRCTGPGCQTTGCRRCIIDNVPYTGNTRFSIVLGRYDMNCTCFCDGTYSCLGTGGFEYSCLGEDCPADQCRPCELDGNDYQLDDKFRLLKNDLIMNCVCECDGAYRCFSISGYCTGPDCDNYGCSSCVIGNKQYKGNSKFELRPGTTCECDCSGQYQCTGTAIGFECVGANCGVGSCKSCLVDNELKTGNDRFQIQKYGLFMQCACNCDSTFTCRGYQIISDGSAPVDIPCVPCVINGKKYNPLTRFQALIGGKRKVCSCDCTGVHSCQGAPQECKTCIIGNQEYAGRSDFDLYRGQDRIRCRCNCNGDFICEGQATCRGSQCGTGCKECVIFGVEHKGGTRFYTGNNPQLLCECQCTGEYVCKGYKKVTAVIRPPKPDITCASCYVGKNEHTGDSTFNVQRGCYQLECYCHCNGEWDCPTQVPNNVCNNNSQAVVKEKVYYNLAGTIGSTDEPIRVSNAKTTFVYRDETSTTIFGQGGKQGCATCIINNQRFDGNTAFILQDGCLRWTCMCNCRGGWSCSSVVGTDCTGPLDPFEGKSCLSCSAFSNTYPPEQAFVASDKCYRYQCMCNCDGSYECPPNLTVKTCADTSNIYDPNKGTCRQCTVGQYSYDNGERFEYVKDCIKYICTCKCDGEYFCPSSTGVRVCRSGSGTPGRLPGVGSQTSAQVQQTVFALKPVGYGSAGSGSSQYSSSGGSSSGGALYGTGRSVIDTNGYSTGGAVGGGSSSSSGNRRTGTSQTGTGSKTYHSSSSTYVAGSGQTGTSQTGTSQTGTGQTGTSQTGTRRTGTSQTGTGSKTYHSSSSTYVAGSGAVGTSQTGTSQTGTGQTGTGSQTSYSKTSHSSSSSYVSGSGGTGTSHKGSSQTGTGQIGTGSQSSYSKTSYSSSSSYASGRGASGSSQTGTGQTGTSHTGSGSSGSYSGSSVHSSATTTCTACSVNSETVPGGRDFTYRLGCTEYNCECFCNGTHVCPAEDEKDICNTGNTAAKVNDNLGCKLGQRTYTTQLFTYKDKTKCIQYFCRCFKNGSYYCDPNKSKRIC